MTDSSAAAVGVRLAKFLADGGVASRRQGEVLIADGRVAVNGIVITTPAFKVTATDRVTVDGQPVQQADVPRLWCYHKPVGLLTTHADPQGRPTVFSHLPRDLPRVVSVGRLDQQSEGLLLLTTRGELARYLELPRHGWVRQYEVRLYGDVTQEALDGLQKGLTIEGIQYGSVRAQILRRSGQNAWVLFQLQEGKNREIRRIVAHLGWQVSRLKRVAYGPFHLEDLKPEAVREVPLSQLRQLLPAFDWPKVTSSAGGPHAHRGR